MPVLICQPVSRRSAPQKIQRWITQLEQLRGQHRHDADAVRMIDHFIGKARGWLGSDERVTSSLAAGKPIKA